MPWGNPEQRSGNFVAHINLRHQFEYETFVVGEPLLYIIPLAFVLFHPQPLYPLRTTVKMRMLSCRKLFVNHLMISECVIIANAFGFDIYPGVVHILRMRSKFPGNRDYHDVRRRRRLRFRCGWFRQVFTVTKLLVIGLATQEVEGRTEMQTRRCLPASFAASASWLQLAWVCWSPLS